MTVEPRARLESANRLIHRERRDQRRRRHARARIDAPIRLLDEMLEELEQMNLAGAKRVPLAFESRIERLVNVLPREVAEMPPMRTNISPVKLMDMVFELQDRLLEVRAGHARSVLDSDVA